VTVYLPPEANGAEDGGNPEEYPGSGSTLDKKMIEAGAAAAVATAQAEEAVNKSKS